jgi:hypothetical protein
MSWVSAHHVSAASPYTNRGDVAVTPPLIMTRADVAVTPRNQGDESCCARHRRNNLRGPTERFSPPRRLTP